MKPSRIFVGLYGAIGDVLLCTPLLESLRTAFPEARISFAVGEAAAAVLARSMLIDEQFVLAAESGGGRKGDVQFALWLMRSRFDWAICLSRSLKMALPLWLARVPLRMGYVPSTVSALYTHPVDYERLPPQHRTDYFLQAADRLGVPRPSSIRLHYEVTVEEREQAQRLLQGLGINLRGERLIAIHPGTSRVCAAKRRWASENYAAVARELARRPGHRVLLLGGPDEAPLSHLFTTALNPGWVNLVNRFSFREFAAVLENCSLLLHNDSAPLHLAGALGIPVVAVFGYQNTICWGPLGPDSRVVRLDLPCSPCLPDFPCPRNYQCIRELPVGRVLQEIHSLLDRAQRKDPRA